MTLKDTTLDLVEKLWKKVPRKLRHRVLRSTQANFLVGTIGIISNPKSQILLLEHRFRIPAPWGLPGGFLQRNETPADGLKREILEETGLVIRLSDGIYETFFDHHAGYATLILIGKSDDQPLKLSPEIRSGGFFEPENIPPDTFGPHLELLRNWLPADLAARLPKTSEQPSGNACKS